MSARSTRGVRKRLTECGLPAAVFFYSRTRTGEHPERHLARYSGLMQADAYDGLNRLYAVGRGKFSDRGELKRSAPD